MAIAYPVVRSALNVKMYGPNAPAATSVIPFHFTCTSHRAGSPDAASGLGVALAGVG
jgi:hypothetical protein